MDKKDEHIEVLYQILSTLKDILQQLKYIGADTAATSTQAKLLEGRRAAAELQEMIDSGECTPKQKASAKLAIELVSAKTEKERDRIMRQLAKLL